MSEKLKTEENSEVLSSLTNIKFWVNRIGLTTSLKYVYFALIILYIFVNMVILKGYEVYFRANFFIDVLVIGISIFAIYFAKFCPNAFQELIIHNKNIFPTKEIYENYIKITEKTYKSKSELYIPVILGLIYALGNFFYAGLFTNFEYVIWGGQKFYFEQDLILINFLNLSLISIMFFLLFLITFSGITILVNTFKNLNKLGTCEFPLKITYQDLKSGSFEQIGKFVIKLSIPVIFLSTFISILGLFLFFALDDIVVGYVLMGFGLIITILLAFLLYKNTLDIHNAISKYKYDMKVSLLDKLDIIISKTYNEIDFEAKYSLISNINSYYKEIENVNDWPFNPTSLRKLIITLGSSVLPLLLSLIGIV